MSLDNPKRPSFFVEFLLDYLAKHFPRCGLVRADEIKPADMSVVLLVREDQFAAVAFIELGNSPFADNRGRKFPFGCVTVIKTCVHGFNCFFAFRYRAAGEFSPPFRTYAKKFDLLLLPCLLRPPPGLRFRKRAMHEPYYSSPELLK